MKYHYEDRLIAFIDILGFSEKVFKSQSDMSCLKILCKALYLINKNIKQAHKNFNLPLTCNITQFSDSIVISIKIEDSYTILSTFRLLKQIQINLLKDNILLRGGIVKGKLIHTKDLLLGPGLISAYLLESKSAQYPRIVIDPQVLWEFAKIKGVEKPFRLEHYDDHYDFTNDFDGTSYIDYFNMIHRYLTNQSVLNYYKNLSKIIAANINCDHINTRVKYLWMKEKLRTCEYFTGYKNQHLKKIANEIGRPNP